MLRRCFCSALVWCVCTIWRRGVPAAQILIVALEDGGQAGLLLLLREQPCGYLGGCGCVHALLLGQQRLILWISACLQVHTALHQRAGSIRASMHLCNNVDLLAEPTLPCTHLPTA